ncbi:MAG: LOG family protein [Hyphomicrobiaceae bacterium]|nr:LOG family protein [Hyphomicrobiaceae bacterium]
MQSKSYRLPIEDTEFILRDEMRAFRFGMEYSKAELVLRDWGIRSTVVVFGSARVPAPDAIPGLSANAKNDAVQLRVQQRAALSPWYDEARKFAKIVSECGGAMKASKGQRDNVIATGGGPGIMEAANRGATEAGAPSIGFNITLPREQEPNAYSTPELTFRFHYFAMRKMHLAMRAKALAVFPGGFGTLDELFEILTLLQTEKMPALPVIMFGREYWQRVINFDAMIEAGVIEKRDLDLFTLVDTAEEGWNAISKNGSLKRKIAP